MACEGDNWRENTLNESKKWKPRVLCGCWTQCPFVVKAGKSSKEMQNLLILGKVTSYSGIWKNKCFALILGEFLEAGIHTYPAPTPNPLYQHKTLQKGKSTTENNQIIKSFHRGGQMAQCEL